MSQLTFQEFIKLPRNEQNERYSELSDHDRFLARMNDFEIPEDWKLLTKEEIEKLAPEMRDLIKRIENDLE